MAITYAKICSNCKKLVPERCDGMAYRVAGWHRLACRGMDEECFFLSDEGKQIFRITIGHGYSRDVELGEAV